MIKDNSIKHKGLYNYRVISGHSSPSDVRYGTCKGIQCLCTSQWVGHGLNLLGYGKNFILIEYY